MVGGSARGFAQFRDEPQVYTEFLDVMSDFKEERCVAAVVGRQEERGEGNAACVVVVVVVTLGLVTAPLHQVQDGYPCGDRAGVHALPRIQGSYRWVQHLPAPRVSMRVLCSAVVVVVVVGVRSSVRNLSGCACSV